MPRVYPPTWCRNEECEKCDFLKCNERVLNLLRPYRYPSSKFEDRPQVVEATSIAIYFGFCQRLARFFLLYPQLAPMSVIEDNFWNSHTGLPAAVSIQRIFLDMLDHGDPKAPTDAVHRFRLLSNMEATKTRSGRILSGEEELEVTASQKELRDFRRQIVRWKRSLFEDGITSFEKTADLNHCKHCFLEDCEQI